MTLNLTTINNIIFILFTSIGIYVFLYQFYQLIITIIKKIKVKKLTKYYIKNNIPKSLLSEKILRWEYNEIHDFISAVAEIRGDSLVKYNLMINWFETYYIENKEEIIELLYKYSEKLGYSIEKLYEGCKSIKKSNFQKTSLEIDLKFIDNLKWGGIEASKAGDFLRKRILDYNEYFKNNKNGAD